METTSCLVYILPSLLINRNPILLEQQYVQKKKYISQTPLQIEWSCDVVLANKMLEKIVGWGF